MVVGNLVDLDELILKCRNNSSKEFIREAVVSYRAGAYRSSIVSCWVAVCYDLIEKLRELALAGDKQAEQKVEELDRIHRANDTEGSLRFERQILAFARDQLELLSKIEHDDLDRILKDRHRCAHPSLNAEGDKYSPPAELARLHIHSAVTHLMQHKPAQGKYALSIVIDQLQSEYFPTDKAKVLKTLETGPLFRGRPSLIRNFITYQVKAFILDEKLPYFTFKKVTESLNAVAAMHPEIYLEHCSEVLPQVFDRATDDGFPQVAKGICELDHGWEFLNDVQHLKLENYVKKIPTNQFDMVDEYLRFAPLQEAAKRRFQCATVEDFQTTVFFDIPDEAIIRMFELYHRASSYDVANDLAKVMLIYVGELSGEQVVLFLSKCSTNSQIVGSYEFPKLLERFREKSDRKNEDFDKLLRDADLSEFCTDGSDDSEEIPF